ncbi:MAG TPA: amino acid ABC transporter permease [Verrucomicrobiales bacterium]|nr:amino acid ABC transporter permease [Verrucomicrobiales bacterium]
MSSRPGERRLLFDAVVGVLLTSVLCALFWWLLNSMDKKWQWESAWSYRVVLWEGWLTTLGISVAALPGSCLVAAVLVAGSRAKLVSVRWITRGFVEIMRGMPLLTLIFIGYYLVFTQQRIADVLAGLGLGSKMFAGIALLSVFTAAYLSEILRGGLDSIPQGQIDSARAVGFDRPQVLRYVIMPQALRRVLPALAGQFVTLVKDSSLLSVIAVGEFTYQARAYNSASYSGLEAFVILGIGYLLITLPIAWFAHWMESRFRYQM